MPLDPLPTHPLPPDDHPDELEIIEPLCAVFRSKLKSEGLKYTPERAQVLDAIVRLDGLFEADQLLMMLKNAGFRVSKATIYRTIRLLQDAGIIQRVLFDSPAHDQAHYQLVYGRRPHDLLIRLDTRQVQEIDLPELIQLRDRICRDRGLQPQGHRFQIFATAAT